MGYHSQRVRSRTYNIYILYSAALPNDAKVTARSHTARYPVLVIAESALHFDPGRPVHSNANLT